MLLAQSDNQLLVRIFLAGLVEDAHVCLATIEGLGRLTETTGKTVVDERDLQDTLESIQNGHGATTGCGGRNFDLFGRNDGVIFSVRLNVKS